MPPMPCFLRSLPLEILTKICQELVDDTASLARLGETCRELNRAVVPVLYREIEDHAPPHRLRAVALVVSLAAYPSRGQYIRAIKFPHPSPAPIDIQSNMYGLYCAAIQYLFGFVAPVPPNQSQLVAILALACLAPNVSRLEIMVSYSWGNTDFLLNKVNNRVTGAKPRCVLPRLTSLVVDLTSPVDCGFNLHRLNGCFYAAPNLTSLAIDRPSGGTSLTARLSHLTTLRLTNALMSHRGLRFLIRGCSNLVSFQFTQNSHAWSKTYLPVSPAQVLACLAPCKATLRKLHLAPYLPSTPLQQRGIPWDRLDTLDEFPLLRQVAVNLDAIRRQNGGQVLARFVWNCTSLEGLFVMGLEAFPTEEFACFARAAAIRPRLAMLKMQLKLELGQIQDGGVYEEFLNDLQRCEQDESSGASTMREMGIQLQTVSGLAVTHPFAED
ncbi:hypothetical protein C8A00DRAFT_31383 [Chaetomidium leptoderma]|uniref:F-box domain-containing protein n=1 Tax=Chaetomidium leptoderma TaxID=669021 RepID=A0AAN6VQV4_9PEZI|nr:hypothetical protein C8A00DRAFT_31383 [Chaetomidium leptoderma]